MLPRDEFAAKRKTSEVAGVLRAPSCRFCALARRKYMHTQCFLARVVGRMLQQPTARRIYSVLIRVHKLAWQKKRAAFCAREIARGAAEKSEREKGSTCRMLVGVLALARLLLRNSLSLSGAICVCVISLVVRLIDGDPWIHSAALFKYLRAWDADLKP